ncbi:PREDICTED: zinc finger protein 785-like [Galeopterus variegatus]|uniref:Zinc finger protein 785-like n=1 Tax=Galeopterus variegatus TaxID=482537 RepID=A0ABM0SH44_GALVR|nr:PREDICTED: zinc finger protein 785-like [Galeopterus variegatus]
MCLLRIFRAQRRFCLLSGRRVGGLEPRGDGNEEKEGPEKSPKQKEMEHEQVSLKQSSIKPWLKDTATRRSPYSCPDCGHNLSYPSVLASHQQVHSRKQPFPCDQCQACFPIASTYPSISSSTQSALLSVL